MAIKKFVKDPNSRLDYTIDWSAWLAPNNDTISNAVVATSTTGITPQSTTWTTTQTTTWVTGGTAGSSYDITVRITTTGGRQDDRTITIVCKEL